MSRHCDLAFTCTAFAEHVSNPKASYIDVAKRRAELAHNKDPRTAQAIASLKSCSKLPGIDPPAGRMIIPPHYISGGHGPINPAEAPATRPYNDFERRVTAGMNQWLVTGSKDEAQCAQQQIDQWAQAGALLDYDPEGELAGVVSGGVDAQLHRHQRVRARQRAVARPLP